ncbi:MAG: DUF2865 domain-containing protein [Xanthobacteraceae bacterium]
MTTLGSSMVRGVVMAAAVAVSGLVAAPAQANDFFSTLFGGMIGQPSPPPSFFPFGNGDAGAPPAPRQRSASSGGRQAFCVRTCDGRYFPLATPTGQSRATSCNELCPASDTKVFYGSNIDHAASENGKSYSSLPNAFRYRNEIVSGCTCNGKDTFGLAKVDIKDDPTLRKGDIVASEDGLLVAHKSDKRGASLNFSPASPAVIARYAKAPIVASEQ